MATHYPLNGIDLDFTKYEHRSISDREVIVNRIMQEYMSPESVKAAVYNKRYQDAKFNQIKSRDRELGLDMYLLYRMLRTDSSSSFIGAELQRLYLPSAGIFIDALNYYPLPEPEVTIGKVTLGLIEQYYLESEPSMRAWLGHHYRSHPDLVAKHKSGWTKDMKEHVKSYRPFSRTHYRYSLFSGGHHLRISTSSNVEFSIDPQFISTRWLGILISRHSSNPSRARNHSKSPAKPFHSVNTLCVRRGKPQRSSSLPPPDSWKTVALNTKDWKRDLEDGWIIYFPRRPLSELDKLSRRRSLSRTHIRAMFTNKPKVFEKKSTQKRAQGQIRNPCANCSQHSSHRSSACPLACGYCNSSFHKAYACPTKASNRCKCMPFPQYHTVFECQINCSRKCGCPSFPGSGHHKNAMLCSYRCCMCGAKGHSGRKCSLKKCPCGGDHLTQDCRWKVECPAKDCNFYLCHLHCRECGKKKDKTSKEHFVGRTCQDCLRNGKPVLEKVASE
ncbi:hypothetical protein F4815DRAFT_483594 [Daldinia loculata]|nr:hypothetical protein F4815DRAFT_483594 [Daldinia loculata]